MHHLFDKFTNILMMKMVTVILTALEFFISDDALLLSMPATTLCLFRHLPIQCHLPSILLAAKAVIITINGRKRTKTIKRRRSKVIAI